MELLEDYKEYLSRYSQRTKETYYTNVLLFLNYLEEVYGKINTILICNISKADIYNYIAYMDKLSRNTKRIRLNSLSNFYNYILPGNSLFEDIKLFTINKRLPACLSLEDSKKLINYYKDDRNRLIIYMLLTTGLRLNEISNLKISDINFVSNTMNVRCKGGKSREVILNSKLSDMLKTYVCSRNGKVFDTSRRNIQQIVKNALDGLGLKGSTHTLRHTAATIMYKSTGDILIVKEFLGHESIESTQIYTHVHNETIKNAINSNPLANFGV